MPKYEAYITAQFSKRITLEGKDPEDAVFQFWRGAQYDDSMEWEFLDMEHCEIEED